MFPMPKEKLVKYLKECQEKGYNIDYVKQQLIDKGWNRATVQAAADEIKGVHRDIQVVEMKTQKSLLYPTVIVILLVVILGMIAYQTAETPEQKGIVDAIDKDQLQDFLSRIEQQDNELSAQQQKIRDELDRLDDSALSLSEKEEIIKEQRIELEKLYAQSEQQRNEVRDLLLELMNNIFKHQAEKG